MTVLSKTGEAEAAPTVFFSVHSPTLDIPMRTEIPQRALLIGNPPLAGTYSRSRKVSTDICKRPLTACKTGSAETG